MPSQDYVVERGRDSIISSNIVLRKTYFLLSVTLLFSAFTALLSMAHNSHPGAIISLVGMFGLLFATQMLRNSKWGLLLIFAFTGFMGYVLGPTLNFYIHNFSNGTQLILTALGGTGAIFFGLSAYTLVTRKDFSYMGGFLFVALMIAFIGAIAGLFLHLPLLQLLISGAFMVICSALIMFYTSAIIHGGETNYIMATISLYIAILNIFVSLLQILGAFSGNRN